MSSPTYLCNSPPFDLHFRNIWLISLGAFPEWAFPTLAFFFAGVGFPLRQAPTGLGFGCVPAFPHPGSVLIPFYRIRLCVLNQYSFSRSFCPLTKSFFSPCFVFGIEPPPYLWLLMGKSSSLLFTVSPCPLSMVVLFLA